jgi:hypothetical protein
MTAAEFFCLVRVTLRLAVYRQSAQSQTQVKVKVALRLAVYRQSVRLAVRPLETQAQRFFLFN